MSQSRRSVAILGSTGSIGRNTLSVISNNSELFEVFALSCKSNLDLLLRQCQMYQPQVVVVDTEQVADQMHKSVKYIDSGIEILVGPDGLKTVVQHPSVEIVVAAIVGGAGLRSTADAIDAGKTVLLANKESFVMAGSLLRESAKISGARIIPIDSEHNAIYQCLRGDDKGQVSISGVSKLILTASGGPFLGFNPKQLEKVSVQDALRHPNWNMGAKISVDSATMINKGLEVIEAHYLFGVPSKDIEVLVHPQSIVHSLVEFSDKSLLAQLGVPDMRIPIAHALGIPTRLESGANRLSLVDVGSFEFRNVDHKLFPCLELAYKALNIGGAAPIYLSAANEVAVSMFLDGQLRFLDIEKVVRTALDEINLVDIKSIEHVIEIDSEARRNVSTTVKGMKLTSSLC
jgi:1-deoxy-D-xylulose-5-phosphate reductoisomerase